MEAKQAQLLELLDGKRQFNIPIYQRTYSWQLKQCEQLLEDIVKIGDSTTDSSSHFIGSIVYFKPGNSPITSVSELLVIDGQQRLTTVSLLLLAVTHFLEKHTEITLEDESWQEVRETYLINKHRQDDSKYKLLLTKKDKNTYINLINEIEIIEGSADCSKRVLENYKFFKNKLLAGNIQVIYRGIKKLIVVVVVLEREKDNPQLVFESLNSKGLDLSQSDLIRNYILMGQSIPEQNDLYEKYWYPMEQSFGENIGYIASFIRDYLTMKELSIPKINLVYEEYKRFLTNNPMSIEEATQSLQRYSKFYVRIALRKEQDPDIAKKLREVKKLKIDTSYPFLIAVYGDYDAVYGDNEKKLITKEEFIEIIGLVASYVFRRAICDIPTNSLNKTFATLYKYIDKDNYMESVKAAFLLMDNYRRFPTDGEFIKKLRSKDIYNSRAKSYLLYLLESLENWRCKELVSAENYTIEHILPQNKNVSSEWKKELGEDWENVKDEYLHTLGNLSLTAYNSELSDKPFLTKQTMENGFNSSPLFLNQSIREADKWDKDAILKRANILAEKACIIWKMPSVPNNHLDLYKEVKEQTTLGLDDYPQLQGGTLDLYKALEKRVLSLDASVKREYKKTYIAFKAQTNFVDVKPLKRGLSLILNTEFDKIKDPKGICQNITNLGKSGNGDVRVYLESTDDLNYVIELIEQVLGEQIQI